MRNSHEISAALQAKMAEAQAADENARGAFASEIEALTRELQDAQINEAATRALANQRTLSPKEQKELKRFSISKMVREAASGKLTGFELEMNDEAEKEMRNCGQTLAGVGIPSFLLRYTYNNSQTSTEGAEFPVYSEMSYVEALKNNLVCAKLGVNYLNGLNGNVKFVVGGGASAAWIAEESAGSPAKQTFSAVTMTPHRLSITNGFTYDLLHQSSIDVDMMMMGEMTREHAAALDAAVFAGSGSSGQPYGIINASGVNTVAIDTNGGPITYGKLVDMEKEVGIDNGLQGRLAYVTNAKVLAKLKTIPQIAGYPEYLIRDGKVNGYECAITNGIPSNLTKGTTSGSCSAAVFGDFSQVVVGAWGGLDMIVDTISGKKSGYVEVTSIAYHDVALKHASSFAVIKDITTV